MTEKEWRENFARTVRVKLRQRRMKQKELAKEVNVSEAAMTAYMRCRRSPRIDVVTRMADAFECTTDELIRYNDKNNK